MKETTLYAYLASIIISAITAYLFRKDLEKKGLIILLPYLVLVVLQETGVFIYRQLYTDAHTDIVYNIYRPVTVIVFYLLYIKIKFRDKVKKIMSWLLAVYLLCTIINFIFFQSISSANAYLGPAGGLIITSYGLVFLFFYFSLDDQSEEKKLWPLMMITFGVVTFYPVYNIVSVFRKYLQDYDATIHDISLYNLVGRLMSIFMYCCFAWAFYLCKKRN